VVSVYASSHGERLNLSSDSLLNMACAAHCSEALSPCVQNAVATIKDNNINTITLICPITTARSDVTE
jgi:hypothetical protein